jgi:cell wall-associated NlpC family hydrolase
LNGNKRNSGCAPGAISTRLSGIWRAALAVVVVLLTSAGLAVPATAQASSARVSSQAAPNSTSAARAARAARAASASAAAAAAMRLRVWRYALAQRDKPYIWGGTGPVGFDCSGLVYEAYRAAGVSLPRTTYEILRSTRLIRISRSQAQRGDLAFFGTGHVELYDGGLLTYGAEKTGTVIGFHRMNAFWHPTMYFRVRL